MADPGSMFLVCIALYENCPTGCVDFRSDGPRGEGGETVAGRPHAAEDRNPHGLEKTRREGEAASPELPSSVHKLKFCSYLFCQVPKVTIKKQTVKLNIF